MNENTESPWLSHAESYGAHSPTDLRHLGITLHVARMGEERGVYRVLVGKRRERDHWGDLGVDGWII